MIFNFITFVALYFCAFMVCFGLYSLVIFFGWIEEPQPPEPPPDTLNKPVHIKQAYTNIIDLSPDVPKKERVRVRIDGVLRLVDLEDIEYYLKQQNSN